jgi:hypothetical protein
MADALGQTRSEYVGQSRQDALDAAHDAGFETRVLDLPVAGDVLWRGGFRGDRLNLVVEDGTVIRAAVVLTRQGAYLPRWAPSSRGRELVRMGL